MAPRTGDFWAGTPVPFHLAAPVRGEARWAYGDGATATGNPAPHPYREPGVYAVTVHVDGASTTVLVPVHWRKEVAATLDASSEGGPAALTVPVPLWPSAERTSATLRVQADSLALIGTTVTLLAETGGGRPLASTRATLAPGENDTLTLTLPLAILAPGETLLRYRVEVSEGNATLAGVLEARSRDPR